MISILDYGAGNIRSISNALKAVGAQVEVSECIDSDCEAIVLPGVGHFGEAMGATAQIKEELVDQLGCGKPFLGLCLGLQMLFEASDEAPGQTGLGIIKGTCKRFDPTIVPAGKIPHMGWNEVSFKDNNPLAEGLGESDYFYFVHSYYAPAVDETIGTCTYGNEFTAMVQKENIFACQFHPERSGDAGLKILSNFLGEVKK